MDRMIRRYAKNAIRYTKLPESIEDNERSLPFVFSNPEKTVARLSGFDVYDIKSVFECFGPVFNTVFSGLSSQSMYPNVGFSKSGFGIFT